MLEFKLDTWTVIGFIGSALYFSRLLLQWILSERAGKPVIPAIYWYVSVAGAFILTGYAVARNDIVILCNYLVPLAIYIRQVFLHHRSDKQSTATIKCPECGFEIETNGK